MREKWGKRSLSERSEEEDALLVTGGG